MNELMFEVHYKSKYGTMLFAAFKMRLYAEMMMRDCGEYLSKRLVLVVKDENGNIVEDGRVA